MSCVSRLVRPQRKYGCQFRASCGAIFVSCEDVAAGLSGRQGLDVSRQKCVEAAVGPAVGAGSKGAIESSVWLDISYPSGVDEIGDVVP